MKPEEIEKLSFSIIDSLLPEPRPFNGVCWDVARRIIHTCGDVDILKDLVLPESAIQRGVAAVRRGAAIFTDTRMAASGITRPRGHGCAVRSLLDLPGVAELAAGRGITRSRAAILLAGERLQGSVIAIGNAPTALLALLEVIEEGGSGPELIVGMPVGFVNAAESKDMLCASPWPHLSVKGRKGGSALAAAAVNALAVLASGPEKPERQA